MTGGLLDTLLNLSVFAFLGFLVRLWLLPMPPETEAKPPSEDGQGEA